MAKRKRKITKQTRMKPMPPTIEESNSSAFSLSTQKVDEDNKLEIIATLNGYKSEAQEARRGGLNPRDAKWKENLDLYWGRYDFSAKADWQAKESMPEVPGFVDRFAAALKEALIATPNSFYTVNDPADQDKDLTGAIKRATDVWLTSTGRNQNGHILPFSSVFEEQVKLGALMACSSVVTWKNDVPGGRVAVESVDPQKVWLDHTYRNLYRLRQIELDRHELAQMTNMTDNKGNPIFDLEGMSGLVSSLQRDEMQMREDLTGGGSQISSTRQPIVLDEYIATVVGNDGKVIADKALFVVANDQHLIRGPEKNPFWHGKDWLTFAPLVTGPLSVYGRTYMEDFGSVANTFNELTNMILDAVHTTSLKAFVMVPGMLMNPGQVAEGISPNKVFMLDDGYDAKSFAHALDLGTLPAESVNVWNSVKNSLREASSMNEIGLGQFAPKGRTSATEIMETQQSSSALMRSIAQTIETRWLNVTLDLVWKTGLQNVKPTDAMIRAAVGNEMFNVLLAKRKEFISRPITFQARGISDVIQKSKMLQSLVSLLGIFAQNDVLLKAFLQEIDIQKLVHKLFELSNIDLNTLQLTEREKLMRSVTEPMAALEDQVAGADKAAEAGRQQVQDVAQLAGLAKGGGTNG